jgi:hypothetical protein
MLLLKVPCYCCLLSCRRSWLDEAGRVVGVEDMDEALVAVVLERAFEEEPAMSPAGEGIPMKVLRCTHIILERRPSLWAKLKR